MKKKRPENINDAISLVCRLTQNQWKYHADLELDLDENLPLVQCCIEEINQVILNIIINASQAIEERIAGGDLRHGQIVVRTRRTADQIQIVVQDNGTGIPGHLLDRIFEPFFTTKDIGKGTGQGLAIAHDIIVVKHQGAIDVGSVPGGGDLLCD